MKTAWDVQRRSKSDLDLYDQPEETEVKQVYGNTESEDCLNPYDEMNNQQRSKRRSGDYWTVRKTRGDCLRKHCVDECFDHDFENESVSSGQLKKALAKVVNCRNKYRKLKILSRRRYK